MKDKHELTEQLKVIETDIFNNKVELAAINKKIEIAQAYEEQLRARMVMAEKNSEALRREFFIKSSELSRRYDTIAKVVDVFTGNFYSTNSSL